MFGLIVVLALAFYLILLIAVTSLAWRWAAKQGLSLAKRTAVTAGAFLIVYLPVFWDHIPTLLVHRYYCDKEAGFWVYKTLEQWKKENPGVMETLIANKGAPHTHSPSGDYRYVNTFFLNPHFKMVVRFDGKLFLNRWRYEHELVDAKTGEVLGRYIDFSTSQQRRQAGWSGWKMWLANQHCSGGNKNAASSANWMRQFNGAEQ